MSVGCRACGAEVPREAAFCPMCGTPVSSGSGTAPAADAVPEPRTGAAPPPPAVPRGGERKLVTALFADVVGSTAIVAGLDPEDWAAIMNPAFEVLSNAVDRFEGTVVRLTGDGILAFFGAPRAHEDDPERAVRAALDMLDGVARLETAALAEPLRLRIGISTGLVVAGDMGSDVRYEYGGFGDAVNIASRMQALAEPGTIVVTADTYDALSGLVDVHDLGEVPVKGKDRPVHAYRVLAIAGAPGRRRGVPGLSSPMVGREDELERLAGAFGTAAAGRGRVAVVVGEPGIGKSRLLEEVRRRLGPSPRWVEGRCASYGRNLPHGLIIDLLRALAGLERALPPEAATDVLRTWSRATFGAGADEAFPYLAHLLGLPVRDARLIDRDPAAVQRHTTEALASGIRASASQQPLVMVVEDLHWADGSSAEVLSNLLGAIATAPVLLIVTSRDERDTPGWTFISDAQRRLGAALLEIALEPLSLEASREVVTHLLEIESLPARVRDTILEKADGNPFFVEEVVRMLIDRGGIERRGDRWVATEATDEVAIPGTVQALLLARIDRLSEDAKATLLSASVLGRRFRIDVLDEVRAVLTPTAGDALLELEAADLLVLADGTRPVEYAFRHALVQDTAYGSLLRQDRRRLHAAAGAALERRISGAAGADAATLARHFEEAGDVERSVRYLLAAADFAVQRAAPREARAFYERVLTVLPGDDTDDEVRWRVEAGLGRIVAGYTFVPYHEAREGLESLVPLAETLGDERLLSRVSLWLVRAQVDMGTVGDEAFERDLERARTLAERLDDPRMTALHHAVLGLVYETRDFRQAAEHFVAAADAYERQENASDAAFNDALAAMAYARLGAFDRADELIRRAETLSRPIDDPNLHLDIDIIRGVIEAERGDLEAAMTFTERGVNLAEEVGNTRCFAIGASYLGLQRLQVGDAEGAVSVLERSHATATYCAMGDIANLSHLWLAAARARLGRNDLDWAAFEAALQRARRVGDRLSEAQILRHRAALRAHADDGESTLLRRDFEHALRILEDLGARPALAQTLREYAEVLDAFAPHEAAELVARAESLSAELELVHGGSVRATTARA